MTQIIQGTCSTEFLLLYFTFCSGWVRTVLYHYINGNDNCILMSKVTPSQRVSEKPLARPNRLKERSSSSHFCDPETPCHSPFNELSTNSQVTPLSAHWSTS